MEKIIIEYAYAFAIEHVWTALTDPAELADWLMPGDFKAVVGHKLTFRCNPQPEYDGTVEVEILEVDKPYRLSYSWKTSNMKKPTTVTFILTPTRDGGTHLRLEHSGFKGDIGKTMFPIFKGGWGHKLRLQLEPVIARLAKKTTK
ncbi:MAG: SRPBCC domain-containing protein [Nitrospiria bacterium]